MLFRSLLLVVACKRCKFVNHDGCPHWYICGKELPNSTIGAEAVTLATNAIVSDYVASLGLEWVPVYRTMSKEGMIRKKARNLCKTTKRRGFVSLVAQWDKDPDWTNSMVKVGWTRDDMLYAMEIYATPGKDPKDHPFDPWARQERAGNTLR